MMVEQLFHIYIPDQYPITSEHTWKSIIIDIRVQIKFRQSGEGSFLWFMHFIMQFMWHCEYPWKAFELLKKSPALAHTVNRPGSYISRPTSFHVDLCLLSSYITSFHTVPHQKPWWRLIFVVQIFDQCAINTPQLTFNAEPNRYRYNWY